jgi:DNA-binding transcriptional LysR family regulator
MQGNPDPLPLELLRWDDVRIFLALVRGGALGPAAKRLDVDASTASRRLVALEEMLGARLFDRSREGLKPTVAAERLLAAAERMEAAAHSFARAASGFEREVEGRVRVSAPPGVAEVFVATTVPHLHEKHPKIVLEIDSRIAVVDLARREADLALRTLRPKGQDLVQKLLSRTKSTLLGSPDYVKRLGTLKRFSDARYVFFGEVLASLPHHAWMKRHMPAPEIVMVSDSYVCQLRAAEAGAGLVFGTPQLSALRDLVEPKMAPSIREALATLPEDDLWLVGHAATREVPRIAAVWAFFEDMFDGVTTSEDVRKKLARLRT